MKIFALSDPHLSTAGTKSMDVFGGHWANYMQKIAEEWQKTVSPEDIVLIPGDICWALKMKEAKAEFGFIERLSGQKVIGRGNHDYWWSTNAAAMRQLREWGYKSMLFAKTNAIRLTEDVILVSTRGWLTPDTDAYKPSVDGIIWEREQIRLQIALEQMSKMRQPKDTIISMMHYPPMTSQAQETALTKLMSEAKVDMCVYGHVHSKRPALLRLGEELTGVKYWLSSCDQIDYKPLCLLESDYPSLLDLSTVE